MLIGVKVLSEKCQMCLCKIMICDCNSELPVYTTLFTKLPLPRNSKETFQSSNQNATCLPQSVEASHCPF